MKRMFFERERIAQATTILFGDRDDYDARRYEDYDELEVVVQDDGRYSVWGNRTGDTDLLRDTHPDRMGILRQLERIADDVTEDLVEPDEEELSCN